jgi:tRNA modification GTPase
MQTPALTDTIIAVSSGWQASPLGIVRLSGSDAYDLARRVGVELTETSGSAPAWSEARIALPDGLTLPATVYWFRGPRSYTGQDVVELHTVGSLPLLRTLSSCLIEAGARRALPGEFTARAFLNGRLDADQVDGVLALIHAEDQLAARQAARSARASCRQRVAALSERLVDLIALVEAGIDFVEEEDVHFITPAELAQALAELRGTLLEIAPPGRELHRAGKPHIALAGLPNAGKSTLFNALLGCERAIVAPVLGTTRDVLSAEVEVGGVPVVLQDCAGLGATADELEAAAHLAAEQAADQADLVLWIHDCTTTWDARETEACRRLREAGRILVVSKIDQRVGTDDVPAPPGFAAVRRVSAATGAGLVELRRTLATQIGAATAEAGIAPASGELGSVLAALDRARELVPASDTCIAMPELVALELRDAWERLESVGRGPLAEDVLGRIMARFCVGK